MAYTARRASGLRGRLRRKALSTELALALGGEILAARPILTPWKSLEERYGLCKARLVQLRNAALRRARDEA